MRKIIFLNEDFDPPYYPKIYLNENYIFNTDNIEINLNRWKKNGDNLLYITGHGGSGKTTLMKEMAQKHKCEIIEFDTISSALIKGYKNLNKDKCHPLCIEYLNKHPLPTNVSWEDIDIFNDECNKFHNWLIKRVKENDCKNSLFILEGQQIFLCLDPELLKDKPIIVMGTSALVSWYRMNKRTSKRKNINGLKKLLLFLSTLHPTYIKKYINDEKKLKELKNLHESVEKEDGFNIDKIYRDEII
jgi:uridine kinase